jgi:WD40 repeat protein/tetratricopeptide (TPR) repeat protein
VAHSLLCGQFTGAPPAAAEGPAASSFASGPASEGTHGSTTLSSGGPEGCYFRGVARVAVQVADALAYAHRQGILHRDIKPSNLLIDQQGTVWITDFGLAKADGADDLTQTGDIVGTVRFMAPERFDGRSLPQSDVYALGITLYELLTLRPAFDDVNKARLVEKVLHEPPAPPRKIDPSIPRDLETVVLKCLAKDPAERYAGAEVLAEDLRRFLADRPIRARRSNWRERTWRWCRRNPVVASLLATVAVLVSVTAVGGVVLSLMLNTALWKAQQAERDGKRKLFDSYVAEADATRMSGRPGQRFGALRRIREALVLSQEIGGLSDEDRLRLRNIAIAALCLPDMEVGLEWPDDPDTPVPDGLDPALRRRALAGSALARLPPPAHRLHGGSWYSPDGRFVAVGLQPYIEGKREWVPARVWRIGRTPVRVLDDPEGPSWFATAFRPDSRQVAFGHRDGSVDIYDTETGQPLRRLGPVPGAVEIVAYHPRLPRLAVSSGGELSIWDVETGERLLRLRPSVGVRWLAWHPRGNRLAVAGGGDGGGIQLHDARTGQVLTEPWRLYHNGGTEFAFNHAGDCLACRAWGSPSRLRDAVTGRQLLIFPDAPELHFGSDDRWLGLRNVGNKFQALRVAGGQELRVLHRPTPQGAQRFHNFALHPGGRLFAVTTPSGLGFFDLLTGEEVRFVAGSFADVRGFDQTGALWTAGGAGFLRWPVQSSPDAAHRLRVGPPEWVANVTGPFSAGGFSADGRVAAVPCPEGALVVHRGASRRVLRLGPQYDVRGTHVSPDGRWVVTASHWLDGSGVKFKVWEADTGKLVANLPYPDVAACLGFSPDSRWLHVIGKEDRRLEVASLAADPAQAPSATPADPSRLFERWKSESVKLEGAFSPDNRIRAHGTDRGAIHLVRADTDQEIARLPSPEVGSISSSAFSADGSRLLAWGHETGMLYVFDLRRIREQLAELGLDWTDVQPRFPARIGDDNATLVAQLEVDLIDADWATSHAKMNRYESERAVARLYFNPFDADAHYRLGGLQLEGGRFAPAHAHLTAALAFGLKSDSAYLLRARAALQLRRWDDAADDATRYLEKNPYDVYIRQLRAEANHRRKHDSEAVADLTVVLNAYPSAAVLYERRADCYEALGQVEKAAADREQALKLRANDPTALNNEAWRLVAGPAAKRDPLRALALIQKAVELQPDNVTLLNTLGVAQYRNGQYAAAIVALEKSLAAGKERSAGSNLFFLAMCHAGLDNPDRAKDCFNRAVKWTEAQKGLPARSIEELKAFRAEAEAELRRK